MFRIGELSEVDDKPHCGSTSSSMGLYNAYPDTAMSRIQESEEIDYVQENLVFGSFDPDDPDFSSSYSSNNIVINSNTSLTCGASSRLISQQACGLSSRPSSRQSLGRNNSSNSLKRTKSTNSMGGSRFFIGTSQSGGGSPIGSNISSCESLTSLLSKNLLLQKTRQSNRMMVFNLSDNNLQQSIGGGTSSMSPITPITPLTLNSYIQNSCEQNLANRMRHQPNLETCFSCGVRWDLQQFTFDCCECGGYAMERKDCPICLGACNSVWERDVLATHDSKKAKWKGKCNMSGHLTDLLPSDSSQRPNPKSE